MNIHPVPLEIHFEYASGGTIPCNYDPSSGEVVVHVTGQPKNNLPDARGKRVAQVYTITFTGVLFYTYTVFESLVANVLDCESICLEEISAGLYDVETTLPTSFGIAKISKYYLLKSSDVYMVIGCNSVRVESIRK